MRSNAPVLSHKLDLRIVERNAQINTDGNPYIFFSFYWSNRPHILSVYRHSNPRRMSEEHKKKFGNNEPEASDLCRTFKGGLPDRGMKRKVSDQSGRS